MLAGRMKLRNFLLLSGLAAGGGAAAYVVLHEPAPDPPPVARAVEAEEPPPAVQGEAAQDGLALLKRPLSGDKLKDATAGKPYKINVYRDSGEAMPNRLKIDLDRDEKWDEKWTVKDGSIQRDIAPADDERYTRTLWWAGGEWRDTRTAPKATSGAGEPVPMRAVEPEEPGVAGEDMVTAAVRAMAGRRLTSDKAKDVTKGHAYKVNLYQDAGESQVNRAKVDRDRDDKWDEKWTFEPGRIVREVAPADDEQYTQKLIFEGGRWHE